MLTWAPLTFTLGVNFFPFVVHPLFSSDFPFWVNSEK